MHCCPRVYHVDVDVRVATQIGVSLERVSAYVMDPRNGTTWIGGIRPVEMLTPLPVTVGSKVRRVASFLGRKMNYTLGVSALTEGRLLEMKATKPFEMTVTYSFAPSLTGTLAIVRITGEGPSSTGWLVLY